MSSPDVRWYSAIVHQEHRAYEELWRGQYGKAADVYAEMVEEAQAHDPRLAAWYHHWRGLALMCADDREAGLHAFVGAANIRSELGRPSAKREPAFNLPVPDEVGQQAKRLAAQYRRKKGQIAAVLRQINEDLQVGPETAKAEEALRQLGVVLGLDTERPDKSEGTGPDVLWRGEGAVKAWGFELKTNKTVDGEYSKTEVALCHDHEEYLTGHYGKGTKLAIVGPTLVVSEKAHPSAELRVIEVDPFRDLLGRVKAMFESVEVGDKTNLEHTFQSWLNYHGLQWPTCVEALDSRLAVDLRKHD